MLTKRIESMRTELYRLIVESANYDKIYKKSTELDLLINEFYEQQELGA